MKQRPLTSALLLSLVMATLGAPAIAQAPNTPGALVQPAQAALSGKVIEVTAPNGLVKAVEEATKFLEDSKNTEVTIHLRTCDQQLFPQTIDAKGKITIVGCNTEKAGVNGNSRAKRSHIIQAHLFDGSWVRSPLELNGVDITYNHNLFKVTDSITIKNSVLKLLLPMSVQEPRLLEVHYGSTNSSNKAITIEDSTLEGARVHLGDFGQAEYSLLNNTIDYASRADNPTVALTPVASGSKPVKIINNKFSALKTWLFGAFISIERPNVQIDKNSFVMDQPHMDAMAFTVMNPTISSRAKIRDVSITNNKIRTPYVMLNAKGAPLDRDAIKFNQNDLTGSYKMLPKTGDPSDARDTVTPKENIDATQNKWGTIDTTKVHARTDNPLPNDGIVPPAVQSTQEIQVNKANGLIEAINEATLRLKNPFVEHIVIRVNTCESQLLPRGIDAEGKISIIGCGSETAAGVNGTDSASRTTLEFPDTRYGVIINSPVEIQGVTARIKDKGFNPNDTLIVKNSVFYGSPQYYFSKPHFIYATMPFTPDEKYLVVEKTTLRNLRAFDGKGQDQNLIFRDNKVHYTPSVGAYGMDLYANVRNKGRSVITGNEFTGANYEQLGTVIRVSRPDVEISRNQFNFRGAPDGLAVISAFDQSPNDGPAVTNLKVEYNRFFGGTAMSNPKSTPLRDNQVQFHYNDLSNANGMLPKGLHDYMSLYSTSPEQAVDATNNYWGDLDTNNVKAIIGNKLTEPGKTGPEAYKPPAPQPPPGNNNNNQGGGGNNNQGGGTNPGGQPNPPGGGGGGGAVPPPVAPPGGGGNGGGGNAGGGNAGGGTNPGGQGGGGGAAPAPNPAPTGEPKADSKRTLHRFSGETRFETATDVSKAQYKGDAKAVILARADVAADSVSAVPLADELDAPILLTQSNTLHPQAAAEIKRLLPKGGKVIFMGGEVALNKQVEDAVTALGGQVERIAGQNRAGTAVETANRLKNAGKLKQVLIADGTDWQADLIAGPAAAEISGATLLTNGKTMAPETQAFLARNTGLPITAIGAVAKDAAKVSEAIEGADGEALSLAVAKKFFAKPKAVGLATTADFADALAGGAHIADSDGPILLMGEQMPAAIREWITAQPTITEVMVYGGTTRIPDAAVAGVATKE